MMRELFDVFSPSGSEEEMRRFLKNEFKGVFDEMQVDSIGNLIARTGESGLCVECGMDSVGVMAVFSEGKKVRFSVVGNLKPKDLLGRKIIFEDGEKGEVKCCEAVDAEKAKISDLYIEADADTVKVGDFGAIDFEFSVEEAFYTGYMLKNRVGLAAVAEALKGLNETAATILFSAQKRLGGRGIRAYFGESGHKTIVTVDGKSGSGCSIIAKDERLVFDVELRKELEEIVRDGGLDVKTVVTDENFYMENVYLSGRYADCAAIGISVSEEEDGRQRVRKSDFDEAVVLIKEILKRGR